jgi:hypothetical protein
MTLACWGAGQLTKRAPESIRLELTQARGPRVNRKLIGNISVDFVFGSTNLAD